MNYFCLKCGKQLVKIQLDEGERNACFDCKIKYTIYWNGVDDSLFSLAAQTLKIEF